MRDIWHSCPGLLPSGFSIFTLDRDKFVRDPTVSFIYAFFRFCRYLQGLSLYMQTLKCLLQLEALYFLEQRPLLG